MKTSFLILLLSSLTIFFLFGLDFESSHSCSRTSSANRYECTWLKTVRTTEWLLWSEHSSYDGDLNASTMQREGNGQLLLGDGAVYVGGWSADLPHGAGTLSIPFGSSVLHGSWDHGLLQIAEPVSLHHNSTVCPILVPLPESLNILAWSNMSMRGYLQNLPPDPYTPMLFNSSFEHEMEYIATTYDEESAADTVHHFRIHLHLFLEAVNQSSLSLYNRSDDTVVQFNVSDLIPISLDARFASVSIGIYNEEDQVHLFQAGYFYPPLSEPLQSILTQYFASLSCTIHLLSQLSSRIHNLPLQILAQTIIN